MPPFRGSITYAIADEVTAEVDTEEHIPTDGNITGTVVENAPGMISMTTLRIALMWRYMPRMLSATVPQIALMQRQSLLLVQQSLRIIHCIALNCSGNITHNTQLFSRSGPPYFGFSS